jgi:hypothetical protein
MWSLDDKQILLRVGHFDRNKHFSFFYKKTYFLKNQLREPLETTDDKMIYLF